jgi:hypothetical protein
VTFPVGLTVIEVTGLHVTDFGGNPVSGFVLFTPSQAATPDASVHLVMQGSTEGVVTDGVMTPVTIPTTDSVSPPFTYTISLKLQTADNAPAPYTAVAIPASLGASVDLSALI